MFEADLWNIDSLSSTICSARALISDSSKIAFQHQCRQENHLCASKAHESFFKCRRMYTFVMAGGEKSIEKVLLMGGFLRTFRSHNFQTQAVFFRKGPGLPITSVHGELRAIHRQPK